ncbi:scavenger receptor class F member 1 isoform X2 [Rhinatrema bivittatum]|nr:scavenger receptor class F member 1 isoform X2 [Rhinatrema bivittatum]
MCCPGWKQEGRECTAAICDGLNACKEDEVCIRPAVCRCKAGFFGANCKSRCPDQYWGPDCKESCLCHPNGRCDPLTGQCRCQGNRWGPLCKFPCICGSHGHCNPLTGSCQCEAGWWSANCKKQCQCNVASSRCDPATGLCVCMPGWWGHRCSVRCNCNHSPCAQYSGKCECQDGWWGPKCEHPCDCLHGTCSPVSGHCDCDPGYEGQSCQEPCATGLYGPKCKFNCGHCLEGQPCSPVDGSCVGCAPGWNGTRCDQQCPPGYHGKDCQEPCPRCRQGESCLPDSGHCLSCEPGWLGPRCDSSCPPGKFGDRCLASCPDCLHGSCNPVTGACLCEPGYWRSNCNDTCPEGAFGLNCTSPCACPHGSCHPVSGACKWGWKQQEALIAGTVIPLLALLLCIMCCYCCKTRQADGKDRAANGKTGPLSRAKHHAQGMLGNLCSVLPCIPLDSSKLSWVTVSHRDTEISFNHSFIDPPSTGGASEISFSSFDTDEEGPVYCVPPREDNSSAAVEEPEEVNVQGNSVPDASVFNSEDVSQPFPIPRTSSVARVKRPSVSFAEGTKFRPECGKEATADTPNLTRKSKIPWGLGKRSSLQSHATAGEEEPQQCDEFSEVNEQSEPKKEEGNRKVSSRAAWGGHRFSMPNVQRTETAEEFSKSHPEMRRKRQRIRTVSENALPAGKLSATRKSAGRYRDRSVPALLKYLGNVQRVKEEARLRSKHTAPRGKRSRVPLDSQSELPRQEDLESAGTSFQSLHQENVAKRLLIPSAFLLNKPGSKAEDGAEMSGNCQCENQEILKTHSQTKDLEICGPNISEEEETEPRYENVASHNKIGFDKTHPNPQI